MPEPDVKAVRSERLASSIHRLLQEKIARGLNDPRIRGLVTVTRIELVDEGRIARAYVSVMPEEHADLTMHGLQDATNFLRRAVMDKIRVRLMPKLEIRYDTQLKRQSDVLAVIAKIERERLEAEAAQGAAASDESDPQAADPNSAGRGWGPHNRSHADMPTELPGAENSEAERGGE